MRRLSPALRPNALLPPGTRLRSWVIERGLAAGGYGAVYLARAADGGAVALKEFLPAHLPCRTSGVRVTPPAHAAERFRDGLSSFFREADMLAHIRHPAIIPVIDVFESHGTACLVMPLERGSTLHPMVIRTRRPGDRDIRAWGMAAAAGIGALHERKILHLDIKPSNLWLRPDGTLLVLDLGASRWNDRHDADNHVHTAGYAAPEQHAALVRVADAVSPATDVYGLCATLWSLISGCTPPSASERVHRDAGLRDAYCGQRSTRLMAILDRGLDLDPQARWPTMIALRGALDTVHDGRDDNEPRDRLTCHGPDS